MLTCLKKWMLRRCGCGPSDCQKRAVEGERSCGTEQPGLLLDTVQEARLEISLSPGGRGGACVGGKGSAECAVLEICVFGWKVGFIRRSRGVEE